MENFFDDLEIIFLVFLFFFPPLVFMLRNFFCFEDATPLKRSRSLDEEHTVSKAGLTPPLESPQSQKTTGSIMIDQMIEVRRDANCSCILSQFISRFFFFLF